MKTILFFLSLVYSLSSVNNYLEASLSLWEHAYEVNKDQHFEVIMTDSCKWLVDDAKWFYAAFGPQNELVKIEVVGDTLIGDRVYAILGVYRQNEFLPSSELIVFYGEENEKVYFFEEDEFKLLFDFSPSFMIGDTISYQLPSNLEYYDISSSSGEFIPTGQPLRHRNVSEDWIVLTNGEQLRVVNTEIIEYSEENCFVMGSVIDGIGSIRGLMGENCMQLAIGFDGFFRCFQSATLNYTAVGSDCLPTSVDEIVENEIKIYPNPTSGQLTIETERKILEIKIFDITGKLLLDRSFTNEIDLDVLASGMYLLELHSKDDIYRKKIIKE